ncbi:hypothetical protein HJC23_002002 [Cyclotella cryptica]|uniref:Fucolectin tachylectin-4 pentraxin-1 domain-containing protein n=1 Tax=Cyclotella cryptica TaxID=29204 RepID=A0ABD3P0A3_9STRA
MKEHCYLLRKLVLFASIVFFSHGSQGQTRSPHTTESHYMERLLEPMSQPTNSSIESLVTPCYPNARTIKFQSTTGEQIQMFEVEVIASGVNLALGKPATQSSTFRSNGGTPKNATDAVDGDMATFSHTNDASPWWMVDLEGMFLIESISILNRWCVVSSDPTGCLCRLSYTTVQLLDEQNAVIASASIGDTCGESQLNLDLSSPDHCMITSTPTISPSPLPTENPTLSPSVSPTMYPSVSPTVNPTFLPTLLPTISPSLFPTVSPTLSPSVSPTLSQSLSPTIGPTVSPAPTNSVTFLCYPIARKVKLQSTTGEQIQMFEVEVIASGLNVALSKSATQSSTFGSNGGTPKTATDAIDGDTATFSHTNDASPWWMVDLEGMFLIESISILNRWCVVSSDPTGCLCRLSYTTVQLLDEQNAVIASASIGDTCGESQLNLDLSSPDHCMITSTPTISPSLLPTANQTRSPSVSPTTNPSVSPTVNPTFLPTLLPTISPSLFPTVSPTLSPSVSPTLSQSLSPTIGPTVSPAPTNSVTFLCYPIARKVKLQSTTGEQIQMFEVEVISSGVNVALGKSATQSSMLISNSTTASQGFIARFATDAVDGDMTTFSHTNDANPWWMVDLEGMFLIESISILNRWCVDSSDPTGCLCLLSNATLVLFDEHGTIAAMDDIGNTCGLSTLDLDMSSYNHCSASPSMSPSLSSVPSAQPSMAPSRSPSFEPSMNPSVSPSAFPSTSPSISPSEQPSLSPSYRPSSQPSLSPTENPTLSPSVSPTLSPSFSPTVNPTLSPSVSPTMSPSLFPTVSPTLSPSVSPTAPPSMSPTMGPSISPTHAPTNSPTISCYPLARQVKLQSITGEQIQMFEVEVISSGVNVALGKSAKQSSTLISNSTASIQDVIVRYANDAIDGDTTTFSHTNDADPWWIVDLEEMFLIESISILNRWCVDSSDPTGCLCRLSNATLLLLDEHGTIAALEDLGNTCGQSALNFDLSSHQHCSASPSMSPSLSSFPSAQPSIQPSRSPSFEPSMTPSISPSLLPSHSPSTGPSEQPSRSPSDSPSSQPSESPSSAPSSSPSFHPSTSPSAVPSVLPSSFPSTRPSANPSVTPSITTSPSESPSNSPSENPSSLPSSLPSSAPSITPSVPPSSSPSISPSATPSMLPSERPSLLPSTLPSPLPSNSPSTNPSVSFAPSSAPSYSPSSLCYPIARKMKLQSTTGQQIQMFEVQVFSSGLNVAVGKTATQSSTFISNSTNSAGSDPIVRWASDAIDGGMSTFSLTNDANPWWMVDLEGQFLIESISIANRWCNNSTDLNGCLCRLSNATLLLFDEHERISASEILGNTCGQVAVDIDLLSGMHCSASPSMSPSANPSKTPSSSPSALPSSAPSGIPSAFPSTSPSDSPSVQPSSFPSMTPSVDPSKSPSESPSSLPSYAPSSRPSLKPSTTPSDFPSSLPSSFPTMTPSLNPSKAPSESPSLIPSSAPSKSPSEGPSRSPSNFPSSLPSSLPSVIPSANPSKTPSESPSSLPSYAPSNTPSAKPSTPPSTSPSVLPSSFPSRSPSLNPSKTPSQSPSSLPSSEPSNTPSAKPSTSPSDSPSVQPSSFPTMTPSVDPSKSLSESPSSSKSPSSNPSSSPSGEPSSLPTSMPSISLSDVPSVAPSWTPSSIVDTLSPSMSPISEIVTAQPTFAEAGSPPPTFAEAGSPPPTFAEAGSPPPTFAEAGSPPPTVATTDQPTSSPTAKVSAIPIAITIPASITLQNFIPPTNQEELRSISSVLEETIMQSILSFLSAGQSLTEVTVTSIGGQSTISSGRRQRRLESVDVDYIMTVEDNCTNDCSNNEDIANTLYNHVTSGLSDQIESGDFLMALKANALLNQNVESLADVEVLSPSFDEFTILTPTKSPTLKPTSSPTRKSVDLTTKPTSSGVRLSGRLFFAISTLVVVCLYV